MSLIHWATRTWPFIFNSLIYVRLGYLGAIIIESPPHYSQIVTTYIFDSKCIFLSLFNFSAALDGTRVTVLHFFNYSNRSGEFFRAVVPKLVLATESLRSRLLFCGIPSPPYIFIEIVL